MIKNKPNFIVIEVMKSLPTSLYTYLKQHPEIFMTKIKLFPVFFNHYKQNLDYKVLGSKSKKLKTLEDYWLMFEDVSNEKANWRKLSPQYIFIINTSIN